jgi:hypothetical protein
LLLCFWYFEKIEKGKKNGNVALEITIEEQNVVASKLAIGEQNVIVSDWQ